MAQYRFSEASEKQLATVKPDLQRLCRYALMVSPIDFGIIEGVRDELRQAAMVDAGMSQTMRSHHLPDPADGLASAVDFMPYWKGKHRAAWPFIYPVADAFMQASKDLDVPIVWGGAWGMDLWSFRGVIDAQAAYIVLRAQREGEAFFDGFHIELSENAGTVGV